MANLVNREAVQKLCAASYLDDYLDCMQNLPNQLQPQVSRIRELDVDAARLINQIKAFKSQLSRGTKNGVSTADTTEDLERASSSQTNVLRTKIKLAMEELGDILQQKIGAVDKMNDTVDGRRRLLDEDLDNLHNCDQDDASLFVSPSTSRIRTGHTRSPVQRSTSPSVTASDRTRTNNNHNESDESDDISDAEASRSPIQSASESDGDSDNTSIRQNTEPSRRGRLGRPPRVRADHASTRRIRQSERGKQSAISDRRSKRNKDRSIRQQARDSTRRSKQDISDPAAKSVTRGAGKSSNNSADQEVDEQLYCVCRQVSYGEMVGCDNANCPMQWFHFNCVSLATKPKGRWYCPSCRGDKPNVRRPDLK